MKIPFLKSATIFGVIFFLMASGVYFIFEEVFHYPYTLGTLYKMLNYHRTHPYQYILVVSVAYGLLATIWTYHFHVYKKWKRFFSMIVLFFAVAIISSIPCGMLWVFHDAQAGHFPETSYFIKELLWGAGTGLYLGWLIVALSIPYNLVMFTLGMMITSKTSYFLLKENKDQKNLIV